MTDPYLIRDLEQLRETIPEPNPMIEQKVFDYVDSFAKTFIGHTPLAMIATTGPDGAMDVSPKGDAPGFIQVEDPKTLLIADRPGNKLAYGFRNILANPRIGIICIVPGVSETLRVNGSAELTRDPEILQRLSARGKPALIATRVTVEECFFHCGKAFIRSSLWKPASWPEGVKANIGKQIAARAKAGDELAEAIDRGMQEDYKNNL